ncbi:MAG: adenylate kinase [Acidimicrobiia bacterium]|nr:adenylate kinase [Acidimicrobiia bacterium]
MGRRLLFLGPPGAGKGTQAEMLARAIGIPHISTGAMLRDNVEQGTELGKQAQAIMAAGDLVPDDLVVAMVKDRLAQDDAACGYLLDGFPRNVGQARALDAAIGEGALELAVLVEADEEELVQRLLQRAQEQGRADDNEETIRNRQQVYRDETEPLVGYYPDNGVKVIAVDGMGAIAEVFGRVVNALAEN